MATNKSDSERPLSALPAELGPCRIGFHAWTKWADVGEGAPFHAIELELRSLMGNLHTGDGPHCACGEAETWAIIDKMIALRKSAGAEARAATPPADLSNLRRLLESLRKAMHAAYSGSAEHGSFLRNGGGEYVPGPHLLFDDIDKELAALRASRPSPEPR